MAGPRHVSASSSQDEVKPSSWIARCTLQRHEGLHLPSLLTLAGRHVHQTEPSDEYEEGNVCEAMQTGYSCGEKLVRAAYVKVSAGP